MSVTYEEILNLFRENDAQIKELVHSQQDTDRKLQENGRQIKELAQETDRKFQGTGRQLQDTDRKFQDTDRLIKQLSKNLGDIGNLRFPRFFVFQGQGFMRPIFLPPEC